MEFRKRTIIFKRWVSLVITGTSFTFSIKKVPSEEVTGITSRCEDMQHILLLDYDNIYYDLLKKELEAIQKRFKLPPFHIFRTKQAFDKEGQEYGNYGAVNLSKMPYKKVKEIQAISHCDEKYKIVTKYSRYKAWVYRITTKGQRPAPTYIGTIGTMENLDNEISLPHFLYLVKEFDIDDVGYTNYDGLTKIPITTYKTASGVTA